MYILLKKKKKLYGLIFPRDHRVSRKELEAIKFKKEFTRKIISVIEMKEMFLT